MMREVFLTGYLPLFVQEYNEIEKIMAGENPEFQTLWNVDEQIRNNLFLLTADEAGVKRYERLLKVYPSMGDSIATRKARILIRINEQPPYTIRALAVQLEAVCGKDGYSVRLDADQYWLHVDLLNVSHNTYLDVRSMLNRMVPANIGIQTIAKHELPVAYVDISQKKGLVAGYRKIPLDLEPHFQFHLENQVEIIPAIRFYQRKAIN